MLDNFYTDNPSERIPAAHEQADAYDGVPLGVEAAWLLAAEEPVQA